LRYGYRFLEHRTDALILAEGRDLNQAFANAGLALVDTMVTLDTVAGNRRERLRARGRDLRALLYNWLELLLLRVVRDGRVYSGFDVRVTGYPRGHRLAGIGLWEPLQPQKHLPKVEVKAPTYHLMEVRALPGHATLRFLLDL
jgi:SHS2 domain-containing protein